VIGVAGTHFSRSDRPAPLPHRALWLAGIAALCLSVAAFVLWGLNGAGILVDMVAAICG
jgi:hypothetical protein